MMICFKNDFNKERKAHIGAAREVFKLAAIEMVNYVISASPVGAPELWKTAYPPRILCRGSLPF